MIRFQVNYYLEIYDRVFLQPCAVLFPPVMLNHERARLLFLNEKALSRQGGQEEFRSSGFLKKDERQLQHAIFPLLLQMMNEYPVHNLAHIRRHALHIIS